jgi:hypothetical protein
MKTMRQYFMLFLFMSAFLLSGPAFALGAKGNGAEGKGSGMAGGEQPMEKQDGKMMQEGTTMKDGGMKAEEMKKDDMKHDEGTMMKDKGMEKDGGMMKSKDTMK